MDTPCRFRRSYAELSGARYLLKVPRPLERARVRAGMDRYESVIAVFPDHDTVLRADPAEVVRRDIDREQLAATVRYSNMLLATCFSELLSPARIR